MTYLTTYLLDIPTYPVAVPTYLTAYLPTYLPLLENTLGLKEIPYSKGACSSTKPFPKKGFLEQ